MNTTDVSPSRLERGKYKVLDLLRNIKEGQTAMLVFSSMAFVVSPLSADTNTIASMLPVINSSIVPVQGSNITMALKKSLSLIKQAGFNEGQIIVITDSIPSDEAITLAHKLAGEGYTISVLGIGTKQGGPITNDDGSLLMDSNGNVTLSSFDSARLEELAKNGNGIYINFTNNNLDIDKLLNANSSNLQNPTKALETKSLWKDEGTYLVWLLIILSAFIARKGWLERLC
jgi:Ca-activated chloride channel family protein